MPENHKPTLGRLSEDERKRYYSPTKPEDLVDALQDSIHINIGRSRPAYTKRSMKSELVKDAKE